MRILKFSFLLVFLAAVISCAIWFGLFDLNRSLPFIPKQAILEQTFTGQVIRVFPSENALSFDLFNSREKLQKRFTLKLQSVESTNQSGNIRLGEWLTAEYLEESGMLKVTSLELPTEPLGEDVKDPAFLYGTVVDLSSKSLKIVSNQGFTYTIEVSEPFLIGHKYVKEASGSSWIDRPGTLKEANDYSALKLGDVISVFYSRNVGEVIIASRIFII